MKTKLDYYGGISDLPKGSFKISPSGFNDFIYKPWDWYERQIAKTDGFEGNTSTVIGTIVHYVAECVGKGTEVDKVEIEKYITKMAKLDDVDEATVRNSYRPMAERLVNDYLYKNMPSKVEEFIQYDLGNGVVAAGSVDCLFNNDTIVDYKTYNSKTKPTRIPANYKLQLAIYAYIYTNMGYNINRIRLVYVNREIDGRYISEKTGKPCGKLHPPEVTVLTEELTYEDLDYIESQLLLCRDTYSLYKTNPELAYILFKDPRLKDK